MRDGLEWLGVRLLMVLARSLPPGPALAVGRALGRLTFRLGVRRHVSLENLRRALGRERDERDLECVAKAAYEHLGTSAIEFLRLRGSAAELRSRIDLAGLEHVHAALAGGRGAIVVSGHYGNWELGGVCAAAHGLPLTFVVQPLRNRAVDALLLRQRRRSGLETLRRGMALRRVREALASNRLVCFMCDQDARRRGLFVPLFGVSASTPKGAAQLALRLQVSFVPVFGRRLPDGRHRVEFQAPIAPPAGASEEAAVRFLLEGFNSRLEAEVRRDPSQYWWAHRRWKTKPPAVPEPRGEEIPERAAHPS